jgi:elongation factor P
MKAYDIKKGTVVEHNGGTWIVRDATRSAPTARGGNTTYRFILYSVAGGQKLDLSLRADDDLPEVDLTRRAATYSYKDGDNYVFMDAEDYTQYLLGPELVGDQAGYVTEGLENCFVMLRDDQPLSLQLPAQVVLEVVDTAPELRGATATKRPKPAKLSTGIEIQVPEYVLAGEKVRVSTETGEFAGRA